MSLDEDKRDTSWDNVDEVLSEIGKANANAKPSNVLQGEQNGIQRP